MLFSNMKRKEGISTNSSALSSAKLAAKQVEGDEIPKEHLNHLGHNTQHILDAYNSAHETLHAPIFVRKCSVQITLGCTNENTGKSRTHCSLSGKQLNDSYSVKWYRGDCLYRLRKEFSAR